MPHLTKTRQGRTTDALGRRVGSHQLRVRCFYGLEFMKQAVVFRIRNRRFIEHVIAIVVLVELGP